MVFEPSSVAPSERAARRVWFVMSADGLVVRDEGGRVALPGEQDEAALGLAVGPQTHYLSQVSTQI